MSLILQQIEKANQRCGHWDATAAREAARGAQPAALNSAGEQEARLQFLKETMGSAREAEKFFERIIGGRELQDVNYLARGARAAEAVARIAVREPGGRQVGWGTGFLIGRRVLITNNHVLSAKVWAERSEAHFGYERDVEGRQQAPVTFRLLPEELFYTNPELDFTVVAVAPQAENAERALEAYGWLPLLETAGKAMEGEWLTIVQHPNGEVKQVCVRENRLLRRDEDVLWYSTDTLGGSSGSPVFNNDWYVVALHHSGVPEMKDGHIQTVDGRDWDAARDAEEKIKWKANEGIRASRIAETLREKLPGHALLAPLSEATPASARISEAGPPPAALRLHFPTAQHNQPATAMNEHHHNRTVTVKLEIDAHGAVRLLPGGAPGATESARLLEAASKKPPKTPAFDVPFDATYKDRKGYDADFLGKADKLRVHLPVLSKALEKETAELVEPDGKNTRVLHYHNYSVVMHTKRRLAVYSAANLRCDQRFDMSRPTDVWREDPRIPLAAQLTNFYYKGNKFDRGHLTRREDLEFGPTAMKALQSAADTCHWTNCTPQHEGFNQNKELWQGIERHLLEGAILRGQVHAQVITGPILEEDDPVYAAFPKIQYPVRYWKVVAGVGEDGELSATAYILDQSDVIRQQGLDEADVFGAYKTFQVKIAEVERLTQLKFMAGPDSKPVSLSKYDPLEGAAGRKRKARRTLGLKESTAAASAPEGYVLLEDVSDIEMAG